MRKVLHRYAIVLAAWLPFFAVWVLFSMTYVHYSLAAALVTSLISMGSASLLGIAVWHVPQRWPWPLKLSIRFYALHICLALVYAFLWVLTVYLMELIRRPPGSMNDYWRTGTFAWQVLTGVWLYGLFAGVSYAVETRTRLHEKETLAIRAQALAASARVDAIRARLNPHFLFNALHTLSALVKFHPALAESAIERLGDMLRYTLKEDGRDLVEFSEEYDFTRQYIAFEQLRYEDRLQVHLQTDSECFHCDIPPFSLQTLAENAVRHAISVRPEGGSIWIRCSCHDHVLSVTVRDDGPGGAAGTGPSHQFGLRSLRERLHAAYGSAAGLHLASGPDGFEARLVLPSARP